MKKFLVVVLV